MEPHRDAESDRCRLRAMRRWAGITHEELGRRTSKSKSWVIRCENGTRTMTRADRALVAWACDVPQQWWYYDVRTALEALELPAEALAATPDEAPAALVLPPPPGSLAHPQTDEADDTSKQKKGRDDAPPQAGQR